MKKIAIAVVVLAGLAICTSPAKAVTEGEIEASIQLGMDWLAGVQDLTTPGDPSYGSWPPFSSSPYDSRLSRTALAVKKFEHYALEHGINPLDPSYQYYPQVKHGLDYLFSVAVIVAITDVGQAGDPDSDANGSNGKGIYFSGTANGTNYETGIALMTIAESNCPDSVVDVVNSAVDTRTYRDVVIDAMDYLAYGQNESSGRGGWRYNPNSGPSDQSVTGYTTLGLAYAEAAAPHGFGLTIHPFVKTELQQWVNNIQCQTAGSKFGGSGYTSACDGYVKPLLTGNLLFEMALLDQFTGTNRDNAIQYLVDNWSPPWTRGYQELYCVMKGLEFQGVPDILPNSIPDIDWYDDLASYIVNTQNTVAGPAKGSWPKTMDYTDEVMTTAWALLTLEKAAPPSREFCICMDSTSVLPGYNATIRLNMCGAPEMGGFDLLVCYDPSGLNFLSAIPLGEVAEWEYFTYRYSWQDNCGGGCPTGYIRFIGIADMPNGETPDDAVFTPDGNFAELTFGTSEDFSFIGQCFHLNYCWLECGDNTVSSKSGDTLYMARNIADILPEEDCVVDDKGYVPDTLIEFCHGIICIVPPEDDRGDINLNGVANEISDAVMFANFFIYGPGVLGYPDDPYYENRRLATDINDDGIPLTVADLVYLIRIITGDANPFPESGEGGKAAPYAQTVELNYTVGEQMVVTSRSVAEVGAAAFVFRHTGFGVGTPVPTPGTAHMTIGAADRDGELRVLVYSMENNSISAGAHELFTVPLTGEGTMELAEVQFSDAAGNLLAVNLTRVEPPTVFALMQNYPNPFNAGTAIRFALPRASTWHLRIYNVTGQLVDEFKGNSEAGLVTLRWDAVNAGSGIYFYKLTAGDFTDTKKMVLMK